MRDATLTMSNLQSLAVPVGANLAATDSTVVVPNPLAGHPQPSGEMSIQDMVWIVIFREATVAPIQVEGFISAELQFSIDSGVTWRTADGCEVSSDADPALAAGGSFKRTVGIGRRLRDELGAVPSSIRYKTVYTTTARVGGDGAATVIATSYLTRGGGE